jgi:hypothetical protein
LVLIAPRASLPLKLNGLLWLLFPGSLVLACCIGWLVLQLIAAPLDEFRAAAGLAPGRAAGAVPADHRARQPPLRRGRGLMRWRRPDGS